MKDISFLYNSIIAHRGIYDNKKIFENSIQSFKKALRYNIPIELDIHLLKDNTIIVFHDKNLKRITGVNKRINSCTYKEVRKIFFNNTEFIPPTLEEVLKLVNGKIFLDIEIKNDGNYKKTCKELTKLLDVYQGNFVVNSFYPQYINWFYKNRPKYIRGILLYDKIYKIFKKIIIKILCKYCDPYFYSVRQNIIKDTYIQKIRSNQKPVIAWTIKNFDEFKYIKNYTDSIICDFNEKNKTTLNNF